MGTALITGGARRIGRAAALGLARNGHDIALHFRSSRDEAETAAAEIRALGRKCSLFQCGLGKMDETLGLMERVFAECPDCDTLINNASIFEKKAFPDTDEEFFDRHFDINFKAPFFLSRDFAGRCGEGNIVNLLDTKVSRTVTEYFAYTLSKKALRDFTRMAAKALAPCVRVNGVCPGLILPPEGEGEEYMRKMEARLPLRRRGSPADIVSAILFFLNNPFVTGECLRIDGGEHLKA